MINKISNFVESVQIEMAHDEPTSRSPMTRHEDPRPGTSRDIHQEEMSDEQPQPMPAQEAREAADKLILESQRFKASVAAPRGNNDVINIINEPQLVEKPQNFQQGDGFFTFPSTQCLPTMDRDNDDDFFHSRVI